jgi:hypothetical protein
MARMTVDGVEWVSIGEAAEMLGISYDSMRVHIRQAGIQGRRGSDRLKYIPLDALSQLARKRTVPGRPARPIHPTIAQHLAGVRQTLRRLEKAVKAQNQHATREAGDALLNQTSRLVEAACSAA